MDTRSLLRRRACANIVILSLLIALCFALSGAWAQSIPVKVFLGKCELTVSPSPVFDGKRIFAPIAILDQLKLSYGGSTGGKTITIIGSNGSPSDVGVVNIGGTRMIAMEQVIKLVGGDITTDPVTGSATIKAHLTSVEFVDGVLRVNCSLPVTWSVRRWQDKLIVDIPDAKLAAATKEVYVGGDIVSKIRLGQYDENTARVVLDLVKDTGFKTDNAQPAAQIIVAVGGELPVTTTPTVTAAPATVVPTISAPAGLPFAINDIRIELVNDTSFNLVIATSGKGSVTVAKSVSPPELTVTLKGATIAENITAVIGTHELLKEARFAQVTSAPALVRVHLNLNRHMFSTLRVASNAITITLTLPDKAGGKLAGKMVVIDAGHGGAQGGARAGSVIEKDLNMKLAAELANALKASGVRTIFTHEKDVTMDLASRPAVAVDTRADVFVSLHCNSNLKPNSRSGIETYYYRHGDSSPLLAKDIQKAACKVTGMCNGGARDSGFMVLRLLEKTGIPGVLVECGYLNHSGDRAKLQDAEYRKKLAAGIVAGLKAYIEGAPIQ